MGNQENAAQSFEELVAQDPTILDDASRLAVVFSRNPSYGDKLGVETTLNTDDTATATDPAQAGATGQQSPQAPSSQAQDPNTNPDTQPEGILAKDGQHVIPYNVLEQARTGKSQAEQLAAQLSDENKRLKEQLNPGNTQAATKTAEESTANQGALLTEEELAALDEEAPQIAKAYRAQQALLTRIQQQVEEVRPVVARNEAEQASRVQQTVDETIDSIPDLANWRSNSAALFSRAVAIDAQLMKDPAWANKTLSERFTEAARLTRAEIEAAGFVVKTAVPDPAAIAATARAKADAALKAAQQASRPSTLSDLPGGTSPGTDVDENLANIDVVALGNRLATMTPEQQDAWLSRYVR